MSARSARGRLTLLVLGGVSAACGGRAQSDTPGSTAQGGPGAGGGASAMLPDAGAAMPARLPAKCPPAVVDAACAAVQLQLDLHAVTVDEASGVSAEPLQVPSYVEHPDDYVPRFDQPDPSTWDRSAWPVGACVFRIRGLDANCQRNGLLFEASCASGIAPGSFYDTQYCEQNVVPGCPSADPWRLSTGYWWYMQPDGADVDLVVCAPECNTVITGSNGACLRLRPPTP